MWNLDRWPKIPVQCLQEFGRDGWYLAVGMGTTLKCGIPGPGIPVQLQVHALQEEHRPTHRRPGASVG